MKFKDMLKYYWSSPFVFMNILINWVMNKWKMNKYFNDWILIVLKIGLILFVIFLFIQLLIERGVI